MEEQMINTKQSKIIVFQLMDEEYGIDVNQVTSIERMQHITKVPLTPLFVKGVINLRGVVIPIINLRSRFQQEEIEYTESTRIIIVSVEEKQVGFIVDAANDVVDIPLNMIEPPPETVGGIEANYLKGVANIDHRLVILLNLEKVLSEEELLQGMQFEA